MPVEFLSATLSLLFLCVWLFVGHIIAADYF